MKKCLVFVGLVSLLFLSSVSQTKALSVTCPQGGDPLVLTLYFDLNRDWNFDHTCLFICDGGYFFTLDGGEGYWEVWDDIAYLMYTTGNIPIYVFSLYSWYGFRIATDGSDVGYLPSYTYLDYGCDTGMLY